MKKLLLIGFIALFSTGAHSQEREMALFMRSVLPALQPRKDIGFYKEKEESTDSHTGQKITVTTYYYFYKPTGELRLVTAYQYNDGSKYPVISNYYFRGDSLQKVGVFPHPRLCRNCYGVYSFANSQLVSRQEANLAPPDSGRLLMNALEYELKAALLFKQPAQ